MTAEEKAAKAAADAAAKANEQKQIAAVGQREVLFTKHHPAYAYGVGETGTLSDVQADALVKAGYVRYTDAETAEAPATDEAR